MQAFTHWTGALVGLALSGGALADPAGSHWSFQPVRRPEIPVAAEGDPVAWFIAARQAQGKLEAGRSAPRRDWIRRLYYNLTGLPPEFAEFEGLLASVEEDGRLADTLVERLLSSPRYGERWARHWLDVARYSDTKGYAYDPEEFNFPHAWAYRDWVIGAFNEDLPYDQFVRRQLAADLLLAEGHCDRTDLAAMGFLTLGRRFVSVEPDIIDDRIDVVTRGLLGLTVTCARCHDHKFDPIPTADYYALYGMFKSSREALVPLDPKLAEAQAGLEKKKASVAAEFEKHAGEAEARFLSRAAEYMLEALDISKVPPPDFAEIIGKDDLNPAQTRRWYEYLSQRTRRDDPVFAPWLALSRLEADGFEARSAEVVGRLIGVDPVVAEALRDPPPKDMADVAARYAGLLEKAAKADPDSGWRLLREVVHGPGSPIRIPRDYIHDVEWLFHSEPNKALKKRLAELEREIIGLGESAPHVVALVDREVPMNVRVFERGQYPNQLDEVPRGSIGVIRGGSRPVKAGGSGRLSFAEEITSEDNPLLARVIANRIWRVHFGEGLVRTESDFGLRSEPPSHPELLDYLASELVDSGWSIKHLQRLIATSSVYRTEAGIPPREDPENRLLTVYPRRRLDFEAMRDTMLAASGELDLTKVGGPPGELIGVNASRRRSIYGRIDRQYLPSTLRVFDFANPELHAPRRYRTNVPQQALFLMNSPFVVGRAKALAARAESEVGGTGIPERVIRMFQLVYGRGPGGEELARSVRFVGAKPAGPVGEVTDTEPGTAAWTYGYGRFDEEEGRLGAFHRLPHFDGGAWGGGASWPDAKLGWVRLTAEGGHVGNDLEHAAVRRWTAGSAGKVDIAGTVAKIEDCGDGIRGWVSSSRTGILGAWRVEFGKPQPAELNGIEVEVGETLDFVVDCGESGNFSCDGFTWAPEIRMDKRELVWHAGKDFGGKVTLREELDVWVRFAQALLISNEAMFLD